MISLRELRAIRLGLRAFKDRLTGHSVVVVCNNSTAVAYLKKSGDTQSVLFSQKDQIILCLVKEKSIALLSQCLLGKSTEVVDALSRMNQTLESKRTLVQIVTLFGGVGQ